MILIFPRRYRCVQEKIDGTDILRIEQFLDSRPKPMSNRTELSSKSDDRLYAFSLDSILSEKECERLVSLAERTSTSKTCELEFTFWNRECKTEEDIRITRAYRNVDTMEFRHESLARVLWERIRPHLGVYETIDLREQNKSDPRWQKVDLQGVWDAYVVCSSVSISHVMTKYQIYHSNHTRMSRVSLDYMKLESQWYENLTLANTQVRYESSHLVGSICKWWTFRTTH